MSKTKKKTVKKDSTDEALFRHKVKFSEMDPSDRIQALMDHCDTTEQLEVKRMFSSEQISEKKVRVVEIDNSIDLLEISKKEFMEAWNSEAKPLKTEHKKLVLHIRNGYLEQTETVYAFPNRTENIMEYYDESGKCIHQRELIASESQKSIGEELNDLGTQGKESNTGDAVAGATENESLSVVGSQDEDPESSSGE